MGDLNIKLLSSENITHVLKTQNLSRKCVTVCEISYLQKTCYADAITRHPTDFYRCARSTDVNIDCVTNNLSANIAIINIYLSVRRLLFPNYLSRQTSLETKRWHASSELHTAVLLLASCNISVHTPKHARE